MSGMLNDMSHDQSDIEEDDEDEDDYDEDSEKEFELIGVDHRRRYAIFQHLLVNTPTTTNNNNKVYVQNGLTKDEDGNTELLRALSNMVDEDNVRDIIEFFPEDVPEKNEEGELPLHVAVSHKYSYDVINLLVEEFPQAVEHQDNWGWYPLHLACMLKGSDRIVLYLLRLFPQAASVKDTVFGSEYYPLQYAARSRLSAKTFVEVLKAYPQVVSTPDIDMQYMLHVVLSNNQSEEIILTVLDTYLLAVKVKGNDGKLPLDIARTSKKSNNLVGILELLTSKSEYELEHRIGIPDSVTMYGLEKRRSQDIVGLPGADSDTSDDEELENESDIEDDEDDSDEDSGTETETPALKKQRHY
jgi:ankyrin repeat protein